MLKTLRISFALKNTYRVNGILYGIRQIPLIGKLFPADIYGIDAFKVLANIIGWIWELITAVFGKILYFFLMLALPLMLMEVTAGEAPRVFLHLFVGLSVMGALVLLVLGIVCGLVVLPKLHSFSYYRAVFQECYGVSLDQMDQVKNAQSEMDKKYISTDKDITSNKQGFELLNDLFIKRHKSLLWKPSLIVSCGALVLIVLILLWLSFVPEMKEKLNTGILGSFSAFVFLMYALNRGTDYTRVLFVNCDHSLLTYSFYKVPGQILKLFRIRLWGIMKVNLLPAVIIGAGVNLLLFASGGTDKPLNYLIIFVSIVGLAVFFSVHYLTMYYLLQPFNAGSEVKNGFYKLIMSLTYIVCYVMWQAEISLSGFGIGVIIFCVLYSVIACLLVYKLAWKTFKIR